MFNGLFLALRPLIDGKPGREQQLPIDLVSRRADANGAALLQPAITLEPGRYRVDFVHVAFQPKSVDFEVEAGTPTVVSIPVAPKEQSK